MSPSPELVSAMLAQDQTDIEQLHQLLEREREALARRDHAALPELIEDKTRRLSALGEHALQRQNWLRSAGLSCDHEGWLRWLDQNPATRAQRDDWTALAERFRHCREQNETNGKIIARAQHTLGRLLDVMRGQEEGTPELYNAKGRAGNAGSSGTLIKA